jgi:hypothetical protein
MHRTGVVVYLPIAPWRSGIVFPLCTLLEKGEIRVSIHGGPVATGGPYSPGKFVRPIKNRLVECAKLGFHGPIMGGGYKFRNFFSLQ